MQRGVISLEDSWQLSSDQYDATMLSSAISSTDAYVLLMSAATGRWGKPQNCKQPMPSTRQPAAHLPSELIGHGGRWACERRQEAGGETLDHVTLNEK